jgi:hypothetical protein
MSCLGIESPFLRHAAHSIFTMEEDFKLRGMVSLLTDKDIFFAAISRFDAAACYHGVEGAIS